MQWHHPLYMANNNYWHQRIPIIIRNNMHRELLGDPLEVQVGDKRDRSLLSGHWLKAFVLLHHTEVS